MSINKTVKTIKFPVRRGITFKSPGPYYGGGGFFYFDKTGKFKISNSSPNKSEIMTNSDFYKKFGVNIAIKKQKNPKNLTRPQILEHLSQNSNIKNVSLLDEEGTEAFAYYFRILNNTHIFDKLFKSGEHILKIYKREKDFLSYKNQKYLVTLSKYGLIPKIFYIDSNVIIMKFIYGLTINKFVEDVIKYDPRMVKQLEQKYTELIDTWERLGFEHGDIDPDKVLFSKNILVTMKNSKIKLYFIDPATY